MSNLMKNIVVFKIREIKHVFKVLEIPSLRDLYILKMLVMTTNLGLYKSLDWKSYKRRDLVQCE